MFVRVACFVTRRRRGSSAGDPPPPTRRSVATAPALPKEAGRTCSLRIRAAPPPPPRCGLVACGGLCRLLKPGLLSRIDWQICALNTTGSVLCWDGSKMAVQSECLRVLCAHNESVCPRSGCHQVQTNIGQLRTHHSGCRLVLAQSHLASVSLQETLHCPLSLPSAVAAPSLRLARTRQFPRRRSLLTTSSATAAFPW